MHPQTKNIALPRWPLPLKNNSGDDVPAFALVVAAASGAPGSEIFYSAIQPTNGSADLCVANGPIQIPYGGESQCNWDSPLVVLYDPADGTPTLGQEWGPKTGSWALRKKGNDGVNFWGEGFIVSGGADAVTSTVHVMRRASPGSTTEQFRLLRGKATANVTAAATSFTIDNITPEANSLDPRAVPGDMAETLTVFKLQKESLRDNEDVVVIYSPAVAVGIDWELLVVERFRAIKGTWYSTTDSTHIKIDNILALESGVDPRADTTDATEQITVTKETTETYGSADKVTADYDAKNGVWVARPKGGGGASNLAFGEATTDIAPATSWLPADRGSGYVQFKDLSDGSNIGSPVIVNNIYPATFLTGSVVCVNMTTNLVVSASCGAF